MVDVQIEESGPFTRPWYLTIRVDSQIVYHENFVTEAKAMAAKEKALKQALTEYVRIVRKLSNLAVDIDLESYNTKPTPFRGTGLIDD